MGGGVSMIERLAKSCSVGVVSAPPCPWFVGLILRVTAS